MRTALMLMILIIASLRFQALSFLLPLFALFLALIGTYEFCRMGMNVEARISNPLALAGSTLIVVAGMFQPPEFRELIIPTILLYLISAFALHMFSHGYRNAFTAVPVMFFAPLYVGLPLACALQVVDCDRVFFMFGLLVVWAGDTGAYYAGRQWGETPMAPLLSPKKTWEGAIGGAVACLLVGFLFKMFVSWEAFPYSWGETLLVSLLAAVVGPLGDLAESALKRDTGIKDSGSSFQGHGGVLDRMDSALFAFALYYTFLVLTERL